MVACCTPFRRDQFSASGVLTNCVLACICTDSSSAPRSAAGGVQAAAPAGQGLLAHQLLCLQADNEGAALQALEPARAAVAAQQHKAALFSAHQRKAAKQAPFLLRFSAAWIHAAMLTTEVSMLEKRKQYQDTVDLLQQLLGESRMTRPTMSCSEGGLPCAHHL